jgi:hypothetical protein
VLEAKRGGEAEAVTELIWSVTRRRLRQSLSWRQNCKCIVTAHRDSQRLSLFHHSLVIVNEVKCAQAACALLRVCRATCRHLASQFQRIASFLVSTPQSHQVRVMTKNSRSLASAAFSTPFTSPSIPLSVFYFVHDVVTCTLLLLMLQIIENAPKS